MSYIERRNAAAAEARFRLGLALTALDDMAYARALEEGQAAIKALQRAEAEDYTMREVQRVRAIASSRERSSTAAFDVAEGAEARTPVPS